MPIAVATRQQAHQARDAIASIALPQRWNSCFANRDFDFVYLTVPILDSFPRVLSKQLAQKLLIEHEILLSGGNSRYLRYLLCYYVG
jgi:hypothetical protein